MHDDKAIGMIGTGIMAEPMAKRLFHALVAHGDGELDHSALIRELRRLNRLPVE